MSLKRGGGNSEFVETHREGKDSRRLIVQAEKADSRRWLAGARVCPELKNYGIIHLGIAEVIDHEIVHLLQPGACFHACFGGWGMTLVDGRWRKLGPGMACLLPPGILTAQRSLPGERWQYCWVRFGKSDHFSRLFSSSTPVLAAFEAEPLRLAMAGLHAACRGERLVAATHHWLELIWTYTLQFSRATQREDRLSRVWERVSQSLGEEWTAERLAAEGRMSFEHLRRLCRRHLGRTPMNQVTYLRIQEAARLLTGTESKLEAIAEQVGFANGYGLSATFKKWTGSSPSQFRQRRVGQSP